MKIEDRTPPKKALRPGYTTGTCAAAAAKAAALAMMGRDVPHETVITLPSGESASIPVVSVERTIHGVTASVAKDAGDDPDITNGAIISVSISWSGDRGDITFCAGKGVGTITKAGLSIPPGEPAINPEPRRMIDQAIRSVTNRGVAVTISIPGGEKLARRTFNPRLGIEGGLSILGTTGRVRPFSCSAIRESIRYLIKVAAISGVDRPVFVPGHIGARSVQKLFNMDVENILEVSNEWGFALDQIKAYPVKGILVAGHPGKLAKLAQGDWDTHSSRSKSAVPYVENLAKNVEKDTRPPAVTVEGIFGSLSEEQKIVLGCRLAADIQTAVGKRLESVFPVSVLLVDLKGRPVGQKGDMSLWR